MSWDTSWANTWGNSWGDAVLLTLAETAHAHAVDGNLLFVIPELRLSGLLTDNNGVITNSGLQIIVFRGTDIYSFAPILQSSSVSVTDGQIAVKSSVFGYDNIGSDYLVVFYDPVPPIKGGGPHPATVVDSNA